MKQNKIVSIIIPVYNNKEYLKKCLDSIICQTYTNLEVLLLDDGSSDGSYEIMKEYAKQYPKIIKVIKNKNNIGVSKTRNKALDIASGDYVLFVDSDDYIDANYIQTLISNIGDNDIIISGYRRVDDFGKILFERKPNAVDWDRYKYVFVAGKMYKNSFLKKYNRKFIGLKIAEDVNFYMQSASLTNKITSISYIGYNYVTSNNSVMLNTNKKNNIVLNIVKPINQFIIDNNINKYNKNKQEKKMLMFFYLKTIVCFLLDKRKDTELEELYKESSEALSWLKEIYNENNVKLNFYFQKGESISINLIVNIFLLMYKLKLLKFLLRILKKI